MPHKKKKKNNNVKFEVGGNLEVPTLLLVLLQQF